MKTLSMAEKTDKDQIVSPHQTGLHATFTLTKTILLFC